MVGYAAKIGEADDRADQGVLRVWAGWPLVMSSGQLQLGCEPGSIAGAVTGAVISALRGGSGVFA
jgi:hypothetical protein